MFICVYKVYNKMECGINSVVKSVALERIFGFQIKLEKIEYFFLCKIRISTSKYCYYYKYIGIGLQGNSINV